MSAGEQHFAYAWSLHSQEQKRLDQVAQALELDPDYVRDPKGYKEREARRARRARAGASGQYVPPFLLPQEPPSWSSPAEVPDHLKRKARIRERYMATLLESVETQLAEIAKDTKPAATQSSEKLRSNPTALRAQKARRDKALALSASTAYAL